MKKNKVKSYLANNFTIFEFVLLAPTSSTIILIGSVLSGLLQSISVLSIMPLMKYLNFNTNGSDSIGFIKSFENAINWLGLDQSIITVLVFMVITTWSVLAIAYMIELYSSKVSAKITRELRDQIIHSILKARWHYFVMKKTGSVIHSIITETGKTVAGYNDSIRFFSAIVQATVLIITTFYISAIISLIIIITGITFVVLFYPWINYAKKIAIKTGKLLQSITAIITDSLHGLKPLKAMNNDRFLIPILNNSTIELQKAQVKTFKISKLPQIMRDALVVLIVASGTFIIVDYSIMPLMSLPPMILLFRSAITQLNAAQTLFQAQKGMEQFYLSLKKGIAEADKMVEKWDGTLDPEFKDSITIDNLSFSYPNKKVLNNVSFKILKNSFIALTGKSGVGKTTFSDILCALLMPKSGDIKVDNQNLNELNINKWRRMIGYVPQDLFLFHNTVMNNINLGDNKVSKEDVILALKNSGSWEFISELPNNINTIIGERGIMLSGGQRQRLSIARAIVRKPKILILDEATTALDPKTEEKILYTLKELTQKGITIIAVSHQEAVIRIADKVYRLENGNIKEVKT